MGRDIFFFGIKRERFVNYIDEIFDKYHLEVEVKLDFINRFQNQIKIQDLECFYKYMSTNLPKYEYDFGMLYEGHLEFGVGGRMVHYLLSDLIDFYNYQFGIDWDYEFDISEYEDELDEEIFDCIDLSYVFYKTEFVNIINWFIVVANKYGENRDLSSEGILFYNLLKKQAELWKDGYFSLYEEEKIEELKYDYTNSLLELKQEVLEGDFDFLYWADSH